MANNAYQELLPANSDMTKTSLVTALVTRSIYVLTAGEDVTTVDLQTCLIVADADNGDLFLYDPTDTTSTHDGVTVQVDLNGRRYKIVDELQFPRSVLDRTNTPPGSPTAGDQYLVTSGATGAWAGQEDNIAIYSALGWKFATPRVGHLLWVEDEDAFYHYPDSGVWTAGLGGFSISADAVTPVEAQFYAGLSVEDVLNTPPGAPSDGEAYLVGTSPTGAFVGHNNKIAYRRSGAWEFEAPYEGGVLYDKDSNNFYTYDGTSWGADTDPVVSVNREEFIDEYDIDVSGWSTAIDFTGLSAYIALRLVINLTGGAAINALSWGLRTSTDNGSTFDAAANDYLGFGAATTASTYVPLHITDASELRVTGWLELSGFNDASHETFVSGMLIDSAGNSQIAAFRDAAEANDAIRLLQVSATVAPTGGFVKLYGRRG